MRRIDCIGDKYLDNIIRGRENPIKGTNTRQYEGTSQTLDKDRLINQSGESWLVEVTLLVNQPNKIAHRPGDRRKEIAGKKLCAYGCMKSNGNTCSPV